MRRTYLHPMLAVLLVAGIYVGSYAVALKTYQLNVFVGAPINFRVASFDLPGLPKSVEMKDFVEGFYQPLQYLDEVCVRPTYWGHKDTAEAFAARRYSVPPYFHIQVTPMASATK
jgi:hypothetical protein